jgi:hypothetical protein
LLNIAGAWTNAHILMMSLGTEATVVVYSSLIVQAGIIRHIPMANVIFEVAAHQTMQLQAPFLAVVPDVSLQALQAELGACGNLVPDAAASAGSGDRQWTTVSWSFTSTSAGAAASIASV